jgi:hypothetical protein
MQYGESKAGLSSNLTLARQFGAATPVFTQIVENKQQNIFENLSLAFRAFVPHSVSDLH